MKKCTITIEIDKVRGGKINYDTEIPLHEVVGIIATDFISRVAKTEVQKIVMEMMEKKQKENEDVEN